MHSGFSWQLSRRPCLCHPGIDINWLVPLGQLGGSWDNDMLVNTIVKVRTETTDPLDSSSGWAKKILWANQRRNACLQVREVRNTEHPGRWLLWCGRRQLRWLIMMHAKFKKCMQRHIEILTQQHSELRGAWWKHLRRSVQIKMFQTLLLWFVVLQPFSPHPWTSSPILPSWV